MTRAKGNNSKDTKSSDKGNKSTKGTKGSKLLKKAKTVGESSRTVGAPKVVIRKEFVDRKIHREATINRNEFVGIDGCKFALSYLADSGHEKIWSPARSYFFPRLVTYFWQTIDKVDKRLCFSFGDQEIIIDEALLAEVTGYSEFYDDTCVLAPPSDPNKKLDVQAIASVIAKGRRNYNGAITKGSITEHLWLLDAILSETVCTNCHSSERTSDHLRVLYDAFEGRWFSIPQLLLAAFEKLVRALKKDKKGTATLHFPCIVTAILERSGFPIDKNEPRDTQPRHFTMRSWSNQYSKRGDAHLKPHVHHGRLVPKRKKRQDDKSAGSDEPSSESEESEAADDEDAQAERQQKAPARLAVRRFPSDNSRLDDLGRRFDHFQSDQFALRQELFQMRQGLDQLFTMQSYIGQALERMSQGQPPDTDLFDAMRLSRDQYRQAAPSRHDGSCASGSHNVPPAGDVDDDMHQD